MRRSTGAAPLLAVALLAGAGCKKGPAAVSDAGVVEELADETLGFRLRLPPTWHLAEAADPAGSADAGPGGPRRLGRAFRRAPGNRSFVVAPRLVVTDEPSAVKDAESFARQVVADLKLLEAEGKMKLERSQVSSRYSGSAKLSEAECAYGLTTARGSERLVHRTLVTLLDAPTGLRALTLTATYLAEDTELVSAEVQAIFGALSLRSTEDHAGPRVVPAAADAAPSAAAPSPGPKIRQRTASDP